MGTGLSYFSCKSSSSRIESDQLEEVMAESKPRDAARSNPETWISHDDVRRYAAAFQVAQEFLNKSGSIMDRQRILETELETCHERLRRFTEDHARVSETVNENISSSNRPSTLEGKYEQFYDHERMDAIDYIENSRISKERDKWTEVDDQRVACLIFEESFSAASILKENFLQGAAMLLTSAPSLGTQFLEKKANKSGDLGFYIKDSDRQSGSLDQSSVNSLKSIMKETAETCNVDAIVQKTLNALYIRRDKRRFQDYTVDFLNKPPLKTYVEKCCKYAWKLVCQTPPYLMEGNSLMRRSDFVFDPAVHQVCREFASSDQNSQFIDIVVWPGLFEGTTGRIIRKTEVLLKSLQSS